MCSMGSSKLSAWLAMASDKICSGKTEAAPGRRCCGHSATAVNKAANSVRSGRCGTSARHRSKVHIQRTDVVIIGNGPSGICLSYMLRGNWPYIAGTGHPDEMLSARLQCIDQTKSLLLQDLQYLSDGLEGRTSNPVALLFDALSNPHADYGAQLPSLLRWEFHPEREIPHVVLGCSDEGGIWQKVENHVQTLSLAEWMQLPGVSFAEWRDKYWKEQVSAVDVNAIACGSHRATAAEVRQYYMDYVSSQRLRPYFKNRVVVTSVERVYEDCFGLQTDCESGEDDVHSLGQRSRPVIWEVRGYRAIEGFDVEQNGGKEEFCYRAPAVVLATGVFTIPNALHVPGETRPFILHSVTELDDRIRHGELNAVSDPVVVIGAGLSAADAILRAHAEGISVVHIFRHGGRDHQSVFRQLPPELYPEYDKVHKLMCSDVPTTVNGYSSYPNATVVDFTSNNEVLLSCSGIEGEVVIRASYAIVLIGSRPNLSLLHGDELKIGVLPGLPVDGKRNPVDVDPWTYQCHKHPGLYAVGPLVGDSFVRFLRGGALGVTSHLCQQRDPEIAYVSSRQETEVTSL